MSDTPRTDAEYDRIFNGQCLPGCDSYGHEDQCPVCFDFRLMADFARQIERENALLKAAVRDAGHDYDCSAHYKGKCDCWISHHAAAIKLSEDQ